MGPNTMEPPLIFFWGGPGGTPGKIQLVLLIMLEIRDSTILYLLGRSIRVQVDRGTYVVGVSHRS